MKKILPELDILSVKNSPGVLSAFAAGTLVYVSMFEIIQREQSKDEIPGLVQLLFVLLGFTAILLFTRYGTTNSWVTVFFGLGGLIHPNRAFHFSDDRNCW